MGAGSRTAGPAARPHVPIRGAGGIDRYKEWWHFAVIDTRTGLEALVNFSFAGNLYEPGQGDANLIFLAHLPGEGWRGGLDTYDGLAARLDARSADIGINDCSIANDGRGHRVRIRPRDDQLEADLHFVPRAEQLTVWKDTQLGSGRINWEVTANMAVFGSVRVGDRVVELAAAPSYHDHNWGEWRWGEFGWIWGFCSAGGTRWADRGAHSLVYNASLDVASDWFVEHSLLVWRGDRLIKLFLREDVRARRRGRFEGPVRRIPAGMALVDPSPVTSVPRFVEASARDGHDWVDLRFEPDAAIQLAVPRETGLGLVELNEALGWLLAEGEIGGERVELRRRACFEFVR
jgi:hypothetical protein